LITEKTQTLHPNEYGLTKLTAELLLAQYHKKTAIIRFSSLYGKDMYQKTFLPRIIHDAKEKKIITLLGNGRRKQDYLHVNDAAVLCVKAATCQKPGSYLGVYGRSYPNLFVAQIVCSHFPGSRIEQTGTDTGRSYEYDASYTKKRFDFIPSISLKKGIEITL